MLLLTRTAGSALRRFLERFSEVRPAPAGRPALQDWLEIVLWSAILLASALTPAADAAGVANAPGMHWIEGHTGGGLCLYKRFLGVECPGCGLTRGFVQLAHGDVVAAVKLNPMTPALFFLMIGRLALALVYCFGRLDVTIRLPGRWGSRLWVALCGGFTLLGVYRVALRFM